MNPREIDALKVFAGSVRDFGSFSEIYGLPDEALSRVFSKKDMNEMIAKIYGSEIPLPEAEGTAYVKVAVCTKPYVHEFNTIDGPQEICYEEGAEYRVSHEDEVSLFMSSPVVRNDGSIEMTNVRFSKTGNKKLPGLEHFTITKHRIA